MRHFPLFPQSSRIRIGLPSTTLCKRGTGWSLSAMYGPTSQLITQWTVLMQDAPALFSETNIFSRSTDHWSSHKKEGGTLVTKEQMEKATCSPASHLHALRLWLAHIPFQFDIEDSLWLDSCLMRGRSETNIRFTFGICWYVKPLGQMHFPGARARPLGEGRVSSLGP